MCCSAASSMSCCRSTASAGSPNRRCRSWPKACGAMVNLFFTVEGLQRLKKRFTIAPLSNGTFATLTAMAKRGGMPWDCIISTELRGTYKPAREAYLLASSLLDVQPEEVMLVAAHNNDLQGAQKVGLRTALVLRPHEWGPNAPPLPAPDPTFDYVASDFLELATQL